MKKVLFITAMALGSFIVRAQHVELGVKGGLNVSAARVNNPSGTYTSGNLDPRLSGHVGGLAHIHLNDVFAIQPEIVFSGEGFKSGKDDYYRLNYLNIPVLAQYMFKSGFRLETGPQAGFLLSGKFKNNSTTTDIKDKYKGVNFAWAFGAGYIMPSGFGFDGRFNLGLTKVNDDNSADIKTGVFQVGVFYQFRKLAHK